MEQKTAWLARFAWGIVTRRELLEAGVTAREIQHRLRTGALIAVFPGVYRVGHEAPSVEASYMAAVKACGEGALLAGRAAAYLYGLIKGEAPPPEVITRGQRRIPGIKTRRARRAVTERTTWKRIPITSVPRTLVDLATLHEHDLARACHEAGVRFGTTPRQVDAVLRPNAPGAGKLRRVLHGDTRVTLSELERRFLQLLREAGVPPPQTNRPAGAHRVDCRWPEHKLTVELDSYTYHRSRYAWEQDRKRDRDARKRGDEMRRYAWDDLVEGVAEVAGLLRNGHRSDTAARRRGSEP